MHLGIYRRSLGFEFVVGDISEPGPHSHTIVAVLPKALSCQLWPDAVFVVMYIRLSEKVACSLCAQGTIQQRHIGSTPRNIRQPEQLVLFVCWLCSTVMAGWLMMTGGIDTRRGRGFFLFINRTEAVIIVKGSIKEVGVM